MNDYELRQMAKDHTMKKGLDSLEFYDQVQSDQRLVLGNQDSGLLLIHTSTLLPSP